VQHDTTGEVCVTQTRTNTGEDKHTQADKKSCCRIEMQGEKEREKTEGERGREKERASERGWERKRGTERERERERA
jgi:hypothetical protein